MLIVALQGPQESEEGVEEASVPATLAGEPVEQPDGSVAVDVMVAGQRAEAVARLAASDRVALVREGTRRDHGRVQRRQWAPASRSQPWA